MESLARPSTYSEAWQGHRPILKPGKAIEPSLDRIPILKPGKAIESSLNRNKMRPNRRLTQIPILKPGKAIEVRSSK
ncbi:hypothetical protein NHQ30_011305 [Ciborinia camelliae]|nr:hypothetical protein NHQ30_011305 [Ciborinia camelliae]